MKLLNDLYVYPWMSFQENNCNTVFIDGKIPLIIDPGHTHLFRHVIDGMARDGKSLDHAKLIIYTHGHPDHIEAIDRFNDNVLKGISKTEYEYLNNDGKELFLATGCHINKMPFKIFLKPGKIQLGDKTFRIIPSPGHSPGSICLYWEEKKVLISGILFFIWVLEGQTCTAATSRCLHRALKSFQDSLLNTSFQDMEKSYAVKTPYAKTLM